MKFWKALRWIASVLLVAVLIWALIVGYRSGSSADNASDATAAPKIY